MQLLFVIIGNVVNLIWKTNIKSCNTCWSPLLNGVLYNAIKVIRTHYSDPNYENTCPLTKHLLVRMY